MDIKYVREKGIDYCSCNLMIKVGLNSTFRLTASDVHLIEHLIFHGHPNKSQVEILDYIENNGGFINAETSLEYTTIFFRIHKSKIKAVLELLIDSIKNFAIDIKIYELERKIIHLEEKELSNLFEYVVATRAINSFYSIDDLKQASDFSTIKDLFFQHYGLNNWTLFIVGNTDIDLEREINSTCNKYSNKSKNLRDTTRSEHFKKKSYIFDIECKFNEATRYFFYIRSLKNADFLSAKLHRNLIVNGFSTPLYSELVDKEGLCYNLYSCNNFYSFDKSFIVFAQYVGDAKLIQKTVLDKCNSIEFIENMPNREFAKVKEKTLCEMYLKCENIGQYSHMIIENYVACGNIVTYRDLIDTLLKMNVNDVKKMILSLLKA